MTPAIAAGLVAAILGHETALQGQTSSHPYRINPNWNKPKAARLASRAGSRWIATARICGSLIAAARTAAPNPPRSDHPDRPGREVRDQLWQRADQLSAWFLHRPRRQRLGDRRRAGRRRARRSRLQERHGPSGLEVQSRWQTPDAPWRGRCVRGRRKALQRPDRRRRRPERRHLDHRRPWRPADRAEQREHVRVARRQQSAGQVLEGRQVPQGVGRRRRFRGRRPLQFNDPHDLAIDAEGRLYIADRGNQRIQVLDKEGNFITRWTQFGKPSAIAIDNKGNIYVADGMSDAHWNPGWDAASASATSRPAGSRRSSRTRDSGGRRHRIFGVDRRGRFSRAPAAGPGSSSTSSSGRSI